MSSRSYRKTRKSIFITVYIIAYKIPKEYYYAAQKAVSTQPTALC